MIPYGKQFIDNEDIQAVVDVLRSDWLTTGPGVEAFENALSDYVGSSHAIAVSSGTAALHCAMFALNIGPGDEVILSPMTFAATANSICFQGGKPVFVDVDPETLLIDPEKIEEKITKKTKAIIGIDYAGQPCEWDRLREIADHYGLNLVADACHALGAAYKDKKVGSLADLTVFSFHPVKHITTGEGGMITTNNDQLAQRMRLFRNHGITSDHRQREEMGSWFYEMVDLGYNYRITDIQCALGLSQLSKLDTFVEKRREIARTYNDFFSRTDAIEPLKVRNDCYHAYHLYVVKVLEDDNIDRNELFQKLRNNGIGVNVHYIPVHFHPYYQRRYGLLEGLCPVAEKAFRKIISLPLWPGMTERNVATVNNAIEHICQDSSQR